MNDGGSVTAGAEREAEAKREANALRERLKFAAEEAIAPVLVNGPSIFKIFMNLVHDIFVPEKPHDIEPSKQPSIEPKI